MPVVREAALWAMALILILIGDGPAWAQAPQPARTESLMVNISWGLSADRLSRGDTTVAMTPGPLFNVKHGTVYMIDRVGGRLLVFDRRGGPVRRDLLPAMTLPFSSLSDVWVTGNKVVILGEQDHEPQVFVYDLETKKLDDLPLEITGEMKPDSTVRTPFTFMLTEGTSGIYLFQLTNQWSMRIFDGAAVPPAIQVPEEGLVVGGQRLRYTIPRGSVKGEIKTVSGKLLCAGMLMGFGGGRIVALAGNRNDTFFLTDVQKGPVATIPRPRRYRVYVTPTIQFRCDGGWYEMYWDAKSVSVVKWT